MNMTKSSKHRECKRVRYDRSEAKFMYDFFEKIYSETDTHFNSRYNPTRQNHAVYVSKLAVVLLEPRLRSVTILSDDYKIFYNIDLQIVVSATLSEMPPLGNIEYLMAKVLKDARLEQILG